MSKSIWHDCKKQPPLTDYGELVLMDSNDKFWVGFCEITSDGVLYFANNAEDPLKNDFVKYARIDKLLALESELEYTREALDIAKNAMHSVVDHNIVNCMACDIDPRTDNACVTLCNALEQIIALEQKD